MYIINNRSVLTDKDVQSKSLETTEHECKEIHQPKTLQCLIHALLSASNPFARKSNELHLANLFFELFFITTWRSYAT